MRNVLPRAEGEGRAGRALEERSMNAVKVQGDPTEREILLDGGPLAVIGVWRENGIRIPSLYKIVHKDSGLFLGPYYASIPLAEKALKQVLTLPNIWDQPLLWVSRQKWLAEWIDKNLGKPGALVGGEWAKED